MAQRLCASGRPLHLCWGVTVAHCQPFIARFAPAASVPYLEMWRNSNGLRLQAPHAADTVPAEPTPSSTYYYYCMTPTGF